MKPTAIESSELKGKFKDWFSENGYDTDMPDELTKASIEFPAEYMEACQEWEMENPDEMEDADEE